LTGLLWFLHHHLFDLAVEPMFDTRLHEAWRNYREVNESFAEACARSAAPRGTGWSAATAAASASWTAGFIILATVAVVGAGLGLLTPLLHVHPVNKTTFLAHRSSHTN